MNKNKTDKTKVISTNKKNVFVVGGIIFRKNKVLIAKRTNDKFPYLNDKWEFPGGKIEAGESTFETIIRELKEELDLNVIPSKSIGSITYEYPDFILTMDLIVIREFSGTPKSIVHSELKWCEIENIDQIDWAAADVPAYKKFMKWNNNNR